MVAAPDPARADRLRPASAVAHASRLRQASPKFAELGRPAGAGLGAARAGGAPSPPRPRAPGLGGARGPVGLGGGPDRRPGVYEARRDDDTAGFADRGGPSSGTARPGRANFHSAHPRRRPAT